MATEDRTNATDERERDAFSIPEFCTRHGISTGHYYNLRNRDLGPREVRVGGRVIISKEAAADWRRDRESAAEAESTA